MKPTIKSQISELLSSEQEDEQSRAKLDVLRVLVVNRGSSWRSELIQDLGLLCAFKSEPEVGESVVEFKENSKKESVCEFFKEIRNENPNERIVMILDNFRSHTAEKTNEKAEELGIELVFLPPYSPDLNPIEQIWRSLKRKISPIFVGGRSEFLRLVRTSTRNSRPSSVLLTDGLKNSSRKVFKSFATNYN